MSFLDNLVDLNGILEDEAEKATNKLRASNGKMTMDDLSYIDKLSHAIKSITTIIAMKEAEEGYSNADYSNARYYNDGGNSYARRYSRNDHSYGRGRYARRDSMGRYSSEGYSRANEEMIHELTELMQEAPDEGTRVKFQSFIEDIRKR